MYISICTHTWYPFNQNDKNFKGEDRKSYMVMNKT